MLQRLGLTLILIISSLAEASIVNQHKQSQLPTALEVVERHIQAVGGRAAWLKIKSQYTAGTIEVLDTDTKGTYEVYAKAPNRDLLIMKFAGGGGFKEGFDGQRSWSLSQKNGAQYDPPEKQTRNKRDADFYKYLHFKVHFPNAKVIGIEEVSGAKAYLIEATPAGEKLSERLYFDVRTGLLILRDTSQNDADGKKIPSMQYCDDYRKVGEIKIAFSLRMIEGNTTIVTKDTEVKNNIALDNKIFNLPESK